MRDVKMIDEHAHLHARGKYGKANYLSKYSNLQKISRNGESRDTRMRSNKLLIALKAS